jgi:hypothetical protein
LCAVRTLRDLKAGPGSPPQSGLTSGGATSRSRRHAAGRVDSEFLRAIAKSGYV